MLQTAHHLQTLRNFSTKKYNLYQTISGIETRITNHKLAVKERLNPPISKTTIQLQKMVLPIGYPWSVNENYLKTHSYQFYESTAGSTISVLCAQALLSSVGVSSSLVATGSASVAINWVLKDGIGEIGKLIMIQQSSHLFDSYPKTCKFIGEYLSVLGSWFQISTLFFPHLFLPLASCAIALRGMHYSIWSSTHTTFNALTGNNMGDLQSKDEAQMSLGND
jgi:Vitamin B6 photo-protection and homoeostasis